MDSEKNIFEAAAKSANPKKNPHSNPQKPSSAKEFDSEVSDMFQRIISMKKDLEVKLNTLYEKGNEYQMNLEKYLDNPKNFSPAEIEKVEKDKDHLYKRVLSILTPATGVKKLAKSKEKLTKERKGKTLGSRKNWISMQ